MSSRKIFKAGVEVRDGDVFGEARSIPPAQRKREALKSPHERRIEAAMEQARKQGYQLGHSEGLRRAEQEARAKLDAQIAEQIAEFRNALEQAVQGVQGSVESWYVEAEERIAKLALEVARRALVELDESHESILPIARAALSEIRESTNVRVRTNPAAASVLDSHREEILQSVAGISGLEIVPDSSIGGGCIVESDEGLLDARVDTFLRRIAEEAA